ncbi:hypothetical protein HN51_013032 [Arachis hypogaea]
MTNQKVMFFHPDTTIYTHTHDDMAYPIRFSINNMRRYHNLFCPKAIIAFTYKQNGLLIGCKFRTMEKIFGRRGCRQSTGFRVFAGMVEWGTRFKVLGSAHYEMGH